LKNNILKLQNIKIILLLILIWLPNSVYCKYSKQYDEQLSKLILTNPNEALIISEQRLLKAELSGDTENQLVTLYLLAQTFDILADSKAFEITVNKGLKLSTNHNNTRFISEFTGLLAYSQEISGNYRDALKNANKAYQLASETNDDRLIAEIMSIRGQIQLTIENYDLAISDIEAAIVIFKKNNDDINTSLNYNLLALLYAALGEADSSLKYYQESDDYDKIKSPYNQAALFYNMGTVFASKQDYKQALQYYSKSRILSTQTNDIYTIAFTNYGMAEIFVLQEKYNEAESALSTVFRVFESNNDILMLLNSNLLLAEIQTINKQFDQALNQLKKADAQSKIIDTPGIYLFYLQQKITYFVAQEMWEEASQLTNQTITLQEKVNRKNEEKLTNELKIKFNAEFDQEKMDLLQNQNKLQKASIKQELTTKKYLWALIVLSLSVLLMTLYAYRNQRKIKKYLYKQSITDYLTNVANRRHIIDKLKQLHIKSISEKSSFALVMIDLDYFKTINDSYGHDIGNEVLIYFAKTAKRIMANIGEIGRIGGEEWLILLPNISIEVLKEKLYELRTAFKDSVSANIPNDCILSFSSGVLISKGQYENHEIMLRNVDIAMYEAKQKGRDQDVFV